MDNFDLRKYLAEGRLMKESSSNRHHHPGHEFVREWLKASKANPNDIGWEDKINTRDIGGYEGYNDDIDAIKSLIREVESQGGETEMWLEPYEVKLETYGDHETLRVEIIDGDNSLKLEEGDSRQEEEHLLKWMEGLANDFDNDNNYFEVDSLDNKIHGDGTDIVHDFIVYLHHEYESSSTTPIDLDTYDVDQFFSTFTEKDYSSDFVNENEEMELTRDQREIEDNFLTYWKLQQCTETSPGKWSVLFNYAFDGDGEQPYNLDVEATSYDEAEHKAYVYTLDYLS